MDVTVKQIKKVVSRSKRGRGKAQKKVVVKEEPCPSFFVLFDDAHADHDHEDEDDECGCEAMNMETQQMQLEIGLEIKDRILPRAILWYTGLEETTLDDDDGVDEFHDYFDSEDDDDDDDDEDEDEDDDDDVPRLKQGKGKGAKPQALPQQETPEECKQQ